MRNDPVGENEADRRAGTFAYSANRNKTFYPLGNLNNSSTNGRILIYIYLFIRRLFALKILMKKIYILSLLLLIISCGQSKKVLENECKLIAVPLFTLDQGNDSLQEYEEKKFTLILSYYGCMANAKRFGGEDPF